MRLLRLYGLLLELYGPQKWWPVDIQYHKLKGTDPRDEVIIGAVLTQNTSWKNVEKSLENLKREGELSLRFIRNARIEKLRELIRPSGFYHQKAERLKAVAEFINPTDMVREVSREGLLKVKGIGPETADAILLYAGERLSFVVDKYTQRFMKRLMGVDGNYHSLKSFFESNLPQDLEVYREFHALIDEHAKRYCRSNPLCRECPLKDKCISASPSS
ncbi:MAG: endonuclease III domain-containing protein [Aquificaceae bacterium]|jgi:endonuclease-3 related protein|uniref:endonuclease III domain-containing protein n=1 Tax=Hydrogenobacter sp. Uz 6-8 TaxID=3384828 RepID=UPI00309F11EE